MGRAAAELGVAELGVTDWGGVGRVVPGRAARKRTTIPVRRFRSKTWILEIWVLEGTNRGRKGAKLPRRRARKGLGGTGRRGTAAVTRPEVNRMEGRAVVGVAVVHAAEAEKVRIR